MQSVQIPPPLVPGDRVCIVAPSGAVKNRERFDRGVEIWRSRGYELKLGQYWNEQNGYLAGTDDQRRQDLAAAWLDPECKAIACARGGYGCTRLLESWQWETPQHLAKWLVGFSDITALQWSLLNAGVASLHGAVVTSLVDEPDWAIARLFDTLEGRSLPPLSGRGWGKGSAEGRLIPGNLTVATHLLGTPYQPNFNGAILAIEDVTELPYRIDRLLTQWRLSGVLSQVAGIAIGRFSRCEAPSGSNSWTVEEVLRDRWGDFPVPIVSELPFGHDGANAALPVGRWARIDGDRGTLEVLSS